MFRKDDIRKIEINGKMHTALLIGKKSEDLPRHIFQGERRCGKIIKNGEITPFYWLGVHYIDDERYVYFDDIDLLPLSELFLSKRSNALDIVRDIAKGLEESDEEFLNLETSIFPLYRIFLTGDDAVVLLPPDIGDVIGILRSEEERISEVNVLIRRESEYNFALVMEMAELLYYAAAGFLPYQVEDVRYYKYIEYPLEKALSALSESLDEKTRSFINFILHAKQSQMRDIMGNRGPSSALSWFLDKSEDLRWNLKNLENPDAVNIIKDTEEYKEFAKKSTSGAKRRTFFRKKGTAITISAILIILLLALTVDIVRAVRRPPETRDLDQEGVLYSFFEAQNDLDPDMLITAVKGKNPEQYAEIVNFYISDRVTTAYESNSPILRADDWLSSGCPDVESGDIVYGVTDVSLERIDEFTIDASYLYYTPYAESEEDKGEESADILITYVYYVKQRFYFEYNKRGWWNISGSQIIEKNLEKTITVGCY